MTDDTQLLRNAAERARQLPHPLADLILWWIDGSHKVDEHVTPKDVARAVLSLPVPDTATRDAVAAVAQAQARIDAALVLLGDRHEDWCQAKHHAGCCARDCECGFGDLRRTLTGDTDD